MGSVTFSKFCTVCQKTLKTRRAWSSIKSNLPEALLKGTLLHECFSRFLNYTNDTKSRKAFPYV